MSIEKYLNEINNEVVIESESPIGIATLLLKEIDNKISRDNISKEKLVSLVVNDIKKMVNKIKEDPLITKKINNTINNYKPHYDSSHPTKQYKISVNSSKMSGTGGFIIIINGDQGIRSELDWLLDDMIRALKNKYKKELSARVLQLDSGDGDEGCIYIE